MEGYINNGISPFKVATLRYPPTHEAIGYSLLYNQLYHFEGLQNYTSGIIHHVCLTGLKPNTLYFNRCGDPSIAVMTEIHHFRTMPVFGPRSYPVRIAVVGDIGLTYNTTTTISHLTSNNPDLVLLIGDVTYTNLYLTMHSEKVALAMGSLSNVFSSPIEMAFFSCSSIPAIATITCLIAAVMGSYWLEFPPPWTARPSPSPSLLIPVCAATPLICRTTISGSVHFIMLGVYTDFSKSVITLPIGQQYRWLKQDLANVDRSTTPWLVATWHSPWYNTYEAHYKEAECMSLEMEKLMCSYGIDIVFNGHVSNDNHQ
ncbi:hypothetical protein COP1_003717 [Malus domestica]